jgi:type IV secretory pathway VirB9-like protein
MRAAGENRCDKFGAVVTLTDTHYRFYGDSTCRSWGDDEVKAVQEAIRGHWVFLARAAAKKAADEAEQARKAAEAEAREVLQETASIAAGE